MARYRLATSNTPIEAAVRLALRRRRLTFREQFRIGPYRADFYLPALRLVIEADGAAWHTLPHQRRRDGRRDAYMRAQGYRVARLTGRAIHRDPDEAVRKALAGAWLPSRRQVSAEPTVEPRARRLRKEEEP